ncbi:hypothetical protein HY029_06175 [Candidatus Gottesmanbacteria bacterium]|nr:hypothetical protein [Candidatus Gottesmanbacteria bacterium]
MVKKLLIFLSIFFVFLSFYPTLYEIQQAKNLPNERFFELVHNYVFDYNFYLSRIKEGQEGRWLVIEKYYNKPHHGSFFQIFYLYLGKIGGIFHQSNVVIYHVARVILGLILLLLISKLVMNLFPNWWSVVSFLMIVTVGSWPILIKLGDGWRFASHWGGWSVIDSLQRITFIPHVVFGQIFLVFFIWKFGLNPQKEKITSWFWWWNLGLLAGIIFPPAIIIIYAIFVVLSLLEIIGNKSNKEFKSLILPRVVFIIFSLPALLYLQIMFKIEPWKALSLFDIQHRSILPYSEYALALGPMLPLGLVGLFLALYKKEKKFYPFAAWIIALGFLFLVFEHIPQQSPTRFTQMLINIPLGILATYLFHNLWQIRGRLTRLVRGITVIMFIAVILLGFSVMLSELGWLTDQVRWKREGTWLYPVGAELVYPLKDFMNGVYFLKDNTRLEDIVLAYEAAGNYIPAYAGNFVYLGHANTPDEDGKLLVANKFFSGKMIQAEAKGFLERENIKYIYFGPQEKELSDLTDLSTVYKFITATYSNSRVIIYKLSL